MAGLSLAKTHYGQSLMPESKSQKLLNRKNKDDAVLNMGSFL
jgi:hypothetical protein